MGELQVMNIREILSQLLIDYRSNGNIVIDEENKTVDICLHQDYVSQSIYNELRELEEEYSYDINLYFYESYLR